MRKILPPLPIVLILPLFLAAVASSLRDSYIHHRHARAQVSLNFIDGACSGTYVGHNTILTAEHCIAESGAPDFQQSALSPAKLIVSINEGRPFQVKHVELDGADHALLTVDAYSSVYVKIDQSNYFHIGQKVVAIGHPGGRSLPEIEQGTYVGALVMRGEDGEFVPGNEWDLAGQPGDSGEALVDSAGHIVAVLSLGSKQNMLISVPFNFTPAQIRGIK